jgi:hypothetical protein
MRQVLKNPENIHFHQSLHPFFFKFFLKLGNPLGKFREATDVGRIAHPLVVRIQRKNAGVNTGLINALHDQRTTGNHRSRRQGHVAGNHPGPADNAVLAHRHTTGNPRTSSQHGTGADVAVVSHLYQIVDLAAIADYRIVQRAAIDGRIGANLDIVADGHRTDLRNLDPVLALRRETEAIGTDNRTGMNNHPLTDPATVVDGDIRIQDPAVADTDIVPHHTAGMDDNAFAEADILAEDDIRRDRRAGWNRRLDDCRRMNTAETDPNRIQQGGDTGIVGIRVGGDDTWAGKAVGRIGSQNDCGRPGRFKLRPVLTIGQERNVTLTRRSQRCHASNTRLAVPKHIAAQVGGDVGKGEYSLALYGHYLASDNALITRSVMSRRGLTQTTSCRIRSNFLGFGNLLDGLVGLFDHCCILFILTEIQILTEFALATLKLTGQLTEFLFLGPTVALRHRHRILFQIFLHALQLLGHTLQILIPLGKLAFQLLGGLLSSRRISEDALRIHITHLQLGSDSASNAEDRHQRCQNNGLNFQLDTPESKCAAQLELEQLWIITRLLVQRLTQTEF